MADEVKQVKVDNWGVYFLQRLKHFFNRTDYCDLTLQFQDNAQLKVHRLVLSACTEYFELLERTCEMYEDCLVMPEDLQADIVVPIVNFMYTGQLEFKMELLEKLYQCSEIMNMPVLTKLLDSHRHKMQPVNKIYTPQKKVIKRFEGTKEVIKSVSATEIVTTTPLTYKKGPKNSVPEQTTLYRDKRVYLPLNGNNKRVIGGMRIPSPIPLDVQKFNKKVIPGEPRPTRYELPEELDSDNIFENSFSDISYTSQPLLVHPETKKKYGKRPKLSNEPSTSKTYSSSTLDIVPCNKLAKNQEDSLFEDTMQEADVFTEQYAHSRPGPSKDSSQLFDQILDKTQDTNITIETKNSKASGSLDHAKIISEVLKKYPHLVKSNKNIKLKILNSPFSHGKIVKKPKLQNVILPKPIKTEKDVDYTFETDVLDSKQAAKLISLGAENIEGPWICLICGTPGKAMNFTSYYKFRRHLVEVHHEKPVLTICEFCGHKSTKRNYLLHHLYTKHGVEPPANYHFPKCNHCNYIAISEALLVKHKMSHTEIKRFRCNVCPAAFHSSNMLLSHIQNTGHKYTAEKKTNYQCIYCQRVFLRETNLCAHLKTNHKSAAIQDGIIDDSDEETTCDKKIIKSEPNSNDFQEVDIHYQIQQRPDGNINVITKTSADPPTSGKQTILNAGLSSQTQPAASQKNKSLKRPAPPEYVQDVNMTSNDTFEEIVMIDNIEYIMKDNQLIPREQKPVSDEYIISDPIDSMAHGTTMEFTNIHNSNVQENIPHANMLLKNPENLSESIPIFVSNEEEYKALMASNQPIIFDSGDSNKTLTVLTAPHTSSLDNTNMDLHNTQANDMMIIQDNYPLNVSEAVPTENSNIVVVYSHPIDGQNKQYQLLNTQALGTQFVQSSAIITQNFGTITTTAPVMNTHVLDKEVQQVWQGNMNQIINTEHVDVAPETNSQVNHPIQQQSDQIASLSTLQSNDDTSEPPEVHLSTNIVTTTSTDMVVSSVDHTQEEIVVEEATINNNLDKSTEIISENNATNISIMDISEDISTGHTVEETVDANEHSDNHEENVEQDEEQDISSLNTTVDVEINSQNVPVEEDLQLPESQTYTQPEQMETEEYVVMDPSIETNSNTEAILENTNEVSDQPQSIEQDNNIQTPTEIENIAVSNDGQVCIVSDASLVPGSAEQMLVQDTPEISQTMEPEWKEENNEEAPQENLVDVIENANETPMINQPASIESCELEESIENIQQEVDKQIAAGVATVRPEEQFEQEIVDEVSDVANSSQDEADYVQDNPVVAPVVPEEAQEKISSLLNDWEDNDSQETAESGNENVPEEENIENIAEDTETVTEEIENPEKQDKIKSLVSDWDEDEEENKE